MFDSSTLETPPIRQGLTDTCIPVSYCVCTGALEVADDPAWSGITTNGRSRVRTLKLIGSKQLHPILLSALEKFNDRELDRLLKLLEVLIVRYQLVGGKRTGRLEISCAALTRKIWVEEVTNATEAAAALRDIMPSDEEFRTVFELKQESNNTKAVYLLRMLEHEAQRTKTPTGVELTPDATLTLEHILPRSPSSEWDQELTVDPDLAEDFTYRLGNLCLLTSVNRSLGNKAYSIKKLTYAESRLVLTNSLNSISNWNRQEIVRRQKMMAVLAVTVWRFQ